MLKAPRHDLARPVRAVETMTASTIESPSFGRDQRIDCGVRNSIATPRLISIPSRAGLLPEAALFAETVGNTRIAHVRFLDIAAFADPPSDVITRQVAHPERPHCHAEFLQR